MAEDNYKVNLTDKQIALIERLASLNKDLPPASAKVWALLFVSDEIELSFDQIKDTLHLSKGATSQAINHLLISKKIDSVTHLKERKRYFKSRVAGWKEDIGAVFEGLGALVDAYKDILAQRPKKTTDFNKDLKDTIDFLAYLRKELINSYQKYEVPK